MLLCSSDANMKAGQMERKDLQRASLTFILGFGSGMESKLPSKQHISEKKLHLLIESLHVKGENQLTRRWREVTGNSHNIPQDLEQLL